MKTAEELAKELQSPSGIGWQESIELIKARDAEMGKAMSQNFETDWLKIVAAKEAEIHAQYKDVVETLEGLALAGFEDFGGSYVNLQVSKSDVMDAREALAKLEVKE